MASQIPLRRQKAKACYRPIPQHQPERGACQTRRRRNSAVPSGRRTPSKRSLLNISRKKERAALPLLWRNPVGYPNAFPPQLAAYPSPTSRLKSYAYRFGSRSKTELFKRRAACGPLLAVFFAMLATGRAKRDLSFDIRGALTAPKLTHRAAILNPDDGGRLLKAIEAHGGHAHTVKILQLAPHVFVRPGELRQAEGTEVDFEKPSG